MEEDYKCLLILIILFIQSVNVFIELNSSIVFSVISSVASKHTMCSQLQKAKQHSFILTFSVIFLFFNSLVILKTQGGRIWWEHIHNSPQYSNQLSQQGLLNSTFLWF